MLEQTLQEIGLTKYESQIYLALLEIGEATATRILKKIGKHIGRVYELLETLQTKGLISEVTKDGVKYYTALSPKKLLSYIEDQKSILTRHEEMVKSTLDKFSQLQSERKETPHIEVYTGFEGLKAVWEKEFEAYESVKETIVFGVNADVAYDAHIIRYFNNIVYRKRVEKKISVKKINNFESKNNHSGVEPNAQIKYLDLKSSITINVTGNATMLSVSFAPIVVIRIESDDVAQGFKDQFAQLWKLAKK